MKPMPRPSDPGNPRPYWTRSKGDNRLTLKHCKACQHRRISYPRELCPLLGLFRRSGWIDASCGAGLDL